MAERNRITSAPFMRWSIWKTMGAATVLFGGLGGLLIFSASTPPEFAPGKVAPVASVLALIGIAMMLWTRVSSRWIARLGMVVVCVTLVFGIAWRAWAAVLSGAWLCLVVLSLGVLLALAWSLPAMSASLSAVIWREQSAPQTAIGQGITKWGLRLGLGAVGVVGASVGTSLVRSGKASLAYLIVALGMSFVALLAAQGNAHQLWRDRPWAQKEARRPGDGAG